MLERLVKENEEKEARIKLHGKRLPGHPENWRGRQPDPSQKAQKVRRKRGRPSKVKLPMRRFTQRSVVNSRMVGLQAY